MAQDLINPVLSEALLAANESSSIFSIMLENNHALHEIWTARQEILNRRQQEISQAIVTIYESHQQELDDIEVELAMYLRMIIPADKGS
jgi:hypothetical protein